MALAFVSGLGRLIQRRQSLSRGWLSRFHGNTPQAKVSFFRPSDTHLQNKSRTSKKVPLALVSQLFSCTNRSKKKAQNAFLLVLLPCKYLRKVPWECPRKWPLGVALRAEKFFEWLLVSSLCLTISGICLCRFAFSLFLWLAFVWGVLWRGSMTEHACVDCVTQPTYVYIAPLQRT